MAKQTYKAEQLVKYGGKWYGPGREEQTVNMEPKEAEPLLKSGALSQPGGGNGAAAATPTNPYAEWNKEKLAIEAESRELVVTRADGKDGDPLVSDYEKALLADDAKRASE